MSPKAWMPLYVGDFLVGTMGWKPIVVGHYIRLLCVNWDKGTIPKDPQDWEYISAGASEYAEELCKKFPICGKDGRCNPRIEREKIRAAEVYEKRSAAGKTGAQRRWGGDNDSSSDTPPAVAPVTDRGSRDARQAWAYVPVFRQEGWNLFLRSWEQIVVREFLDVSMVVDSFQAYYASPKGRGKFCRGAIKLLEGAVWEESPEAWKTADEECREDSMALLDDVIGGDA
jgi:uncharacterized protein YdaU (DUF1376 family)